MSAPTKCHCCRQYSRDRTRLSGWRPGVRHGRLLHQCCPLSFPRGADRDIRRQRQHRRSSVPKDGGDDVRPYAISRRASRNIHLQLRSSSGQQLHSGWNQGVRWSQTLHTSILKDSNCASPSTTKPGFGGFPSATSLRRSWCIFRIAFFRTRNPSHRALKAWRMCASWRRVISAHTAKPVHLPPFSKSTRPTPRQEIGRPAHGLPKTVKV